MARDAIATLPIRFSVELTWMKAVRQAARSCAPARDKGLHVFVTEVVSAPEKAAKRARNPLFRAAEHRSRDASFVITHHVVSYFPFLFSPSLSLSRRLGRALPDPRRRLHSLLQPPLLTPASFIDRP